MLYKKFILLKKKAKVFSLEWLPKYEKQVMYLEKKTGHEAGHFML